jgi:peroxiredoxin
MSLITQAEVLGAARTLEAAVTQNGNRLVDLAGESPILLVFLRYAGCTFCREALGDIAAGRRAIEKTGARIVLVHMSREPEIRKLAARYQLQDVDRIRDTGRVLYRTFGLKRARLAQLAGPKVWWRGFRSAVLTGHGQGLPDASVLQMPGVFLLEKGELVRSFRHRSVADRPAYAELAGAAAMAGEG